MVTMAPSVFDVRRRHLSECGDLVGTAPHKTMYLSRVNCFADDGI